MSRNTATLKETETSEDFLFEEGRRNGAAYAERAPCRELVLVEKFVSKFGTDFGRVEITSVMLAREACETESLDLDSRSWIADNLAEDFESEESYVRGFLEGAIDWMESATNAARLQGEKAALEETLFDEGHRDGRGYGKRAPKRDLKRIDKMVEAFGSEFRMVDVNADMMACAVCKVESPDCDTRYWVETNLSTFWQDEEAYVRGFVEGALEVLTEADSAESKKD